MTETPTLSSPRYHDLDAVRAFALILGIAFHGAMSFMTPRIWIIDDTAHSTGLNVVFYLLHMFRMTAFFVLAGFFARMLLQKRGAGGFIKNRLVRIAVPLVVFWPFMLAAIITALVIGNPPVPGAPPAPPPPLTAATFPLTHLWFLYVLLFLYAGALVLAGVTKLLGIGGVLGDLLDKVMSGLIRANLMTLLLALPLAVLFYLSHGWAMWFGIPTPDTGVVPNIYAAAGFTTAFVFGWWLHRQPELLDVMARKAWLYILSAFAGVWACLYIAGPTPILATATGAEHPIYAVLYPLTTWTIVFALIGAARRYLKAENPVIRYLADGSYWIYIIHLPVLLGLEIAVKGLAWPAEAKYAAVVLGTFVVALLSYALLVRYSFIGAILNGKRPRKPKADPRAQEELA